MWICQKNNLVWQGGKGSWGTRSSVICAGTEEMKANGGERQTELETTGSNEEPTMTRWWVLVQVQQTELKEAKGKVSLD